LAAEHHAGQGGTHDHRIALRAHPELRQGGAGARRLGFRLRQLGFGQLVVGLRALELLAGDRLGCQQPLRPLARGAGVCRTGAAGVQVRDGLVIIRPRAACRRTLQRDKAWPRETRSPTCTCTVTTRACAGAPRRAVESSLGTSWPGTSETAAT